MFGTLAITRLGRFRVTAQNMVTRCCDFNCRNYLTDYAHIYIYFFFQVTTRSPLCFLHLFIDCLFRCVVILLLSYHYFLYAKCYLPSFFAQVLFIDFMSCSYLMYICTAVSLSRRRSVGAAKPYFCGFLPTVRDISVCGY